MNSTLNLAQKHDIEIVKPEKTITQITAEEHVDPEALRGVNTTPTFHDNEEQALNESHIAL